MRPVAVPWTTLIKQIGLKERVKSSIVGQVLCEKMELEDSKIVKSKMLNLTFCFKGLIVNIKYFMGRFLIL